MLWAFFLPANAQVALAFTVSLPLAEFKNSISASSKVSKGDATIHTPVNLGHEKPVADSLEFVSQLVLDIQSTPTFTCSRGQYSAIKGLFASHAFVFASAANNGMGTASKFW
jgi:hypothetical protein